MVTIAPTSQPAYKGFWFSPEQSDFMDQREPQRQSPRQTYSAPLTDPLSQHSFLSSAAFPVPSQPAFDLKLPETYKPTATKRKRSETGDPTMSQQPSQRRRRDEPPTIDPQNLTNTYAAPVTQYLPDQYANTMPVAGPSTSPYAGWQSLPTDRATPASLDPSSTQYSTPYSYSAFEPSPGPSGFSSNTRTSSIASTSSQTMAPLYAQPFQSYDQLAYQQTPAYQPQTTYATYPNPYAMQSIPSAQPGYLPSSTSGGRGRGISTPTMTPDFSGRPQTTPGQSADPAPRPKPQCWQHGCNGREFSTFSNLLRHQRERQGTAPRSICPRCGAEFTRSTARTNHLLGSKCKPRRSSN